MDINSVFFSKYLKAADLQGRRVPITIDSVQIEDIVGDGNKINFKPVVCFTGKSSELVLNKTTAAIIAAAFGPETNHWAGRTIELYPTDVLFQGRSVQAIRITATSVPKVAEPVGKIAFDAADIPF